VRDFVFLDFDFLLVDSIRLDVFSIDLSLETCVPAAFFAAMIAPRE